MTLRLGRNPIALLLLVLVTGIASLTLFAAPARALTCQRTNVPNNGGFADFYHGTSDKYAHAIRDNGIDPGKGQAKTDFGRGFYLTVIRRQAEEWARKNFALDGPTVMHFRVPYGDLAAGPGSLCGRVFGSADAEYLGFVRHHRVNGPATGGAGYDFVEGPLLLNPREFVNGSPPVTGGQQDSFHTPKAAAILDGAFSDMYAVRSAAKR
jgi:Protein of unknown function (DUF3990)